MKLQKLASIFTFALCIVQNTHAGVGLTEIKGKADDGVVTVFYPTDASVNTIQRGPFEFKASIDAKPSEGNHRLVIISHGSGGAPWVHTDFATRLVEEGFIVAFPTHFRDNYDSTRDAGPRSWKRRPLEVSRSIDAVAEDPRFAALIDFSKVGMYGMSAGGHTALTLAGGAWSPAQLRKHCQANIDVDFQTCVPPIMRMNDGGFWDSIKKSLVLFVQGLTLTDETPQTHTDPRIKAIIAGVPFAADFDMSSLKSPAVPLALVTASKDKWLAPRFHSDKVLVTCKTCILISNFDTGGHGALLSPLPPKLTGLLAELIYDPDGFDRKETIVMDQKMIAFFQKQLLP